MKLIPVQSSQLVGIAYQPGHTKFYIQFQNGSVYEYDGGQDTAEIITEILFANSPGTTFSRLKADLPYLKIENPEELDLHV